MTRRDLGDLLLLAALWGASFLFMRMGAGEFGPLALSAVRVALAVAVLLPLLAMRRQVATLQAHWRPIALVGVVNSALPFAAFAYAAMHITTGLSGVFNATSPLWGALVAWVWLNERPTRWQGLGLALGFVGVAWLAWDKAGIKPGAAPDGTAWAVLACVSATLLYGIGANFARKKLAGVPALAVATGSQAAAALFLAPLAVWAWPSQMPGLRSWAAVALLGVLCTALAYLLYFRLIARVGAARAISVTFLIPLFAVAWGWLLLGEVVTPVMVGAGIVIVLGTALATGVLKPRPAR